MNITYLFGAGASYNALPIVEQIPIRLEAFANDFETEPLKDLTPMSFINGGNLAKSYLIKLDSDKPQQEKYFHFINDFHKDILWLRDESNKHSSIDTFAKKLYLQGQNTMLKKLKFILSCFFLYEQTYRFDKRYDSFYASILEEDLWSFPHDLRVLSWNYDSQFEIAYNNFTSSTIENTRKSLNVLTKENKNLKYAKTDKFGIFKINGTTNFIDDKFETHDLVTSFIDKGNWLVESFLNLYSNMNLFENHQSNLSFAWENFKEKSDFNQKLSNSISETDILIVIGYSFPFFNRKIDKFILDSMPNLSTVYVQDPYHAEDIIEKIKGLIPNCNLTNPTKDSKQIDFISKTFKDQFFIPIEF